MSTTRLKRALGALSISLAAAAPALAGIITFEDVTPGLGAPFYTTVATDGVSYRFESDLFGSSGVGNASAFPFGPAPLSSTGQFLFALNNDGQTMSRSDRGRFQLKSFDLGVIASLPGIGSAGSPGQMHVIGKDAHAQIHSEIFDLAGANINGDYSFSSYSNMGSLTGIGFTMVGFFGCLYDVNGFCSFSNRARPAQFALDNITNFTVTEPASAALALAALALLGAARRRAVCAPQGPSVGT